MTRTSKKTGQAEVAGMQERLAAEMVKRAREQGVALTGPDGLLGQGSRLQDDAALDSPASGF